MTYEIMCSCDHPLQVTQVPCTLLTTDPDPQSSPPAEYGVVRLAGGYSDDSCVFSCSGPDLRPIVDDRADILTRRSTYGSIQNF